jgi:hypothetical protein
MLVTPQLLPTLAALDRRGGEGASQSSSVLKKRSTAGSENINLGYPDTIQAEGNSRR